MKNFTLVVLLFFFGLGIQAQVKKEDPLMQEVMELHDSIMAKMPRTVNYINQLQAKAQNTAETPEIRTAITHLKKANQSMTDWMQGFGKQFSADEMFGKKALSKEKIHILEQEKIKILAVGEQIKASMEGAEKVL
ncbi:MAG: hypothetical protein AB3N16_09655 [Flavobacteriaceae bacterium]